MKKVDFVAFCHFIADMFQIISELSKSLQKNDLILPMAITAVRRTMDELENLLVWPKRNGHLSAFLTALQAQMEGQEDNDDNDEDEDANRSVKLSDSTRLTCKLKFDQDSVLSSVRNEGVT